MSLLQGRRYAWRLALLFLVLFLSPPVFAVRGGVETVRFSGERYRTSARDVPAHAREVFAYVIKNGQAPRGYVGDRVWQNREHRLPAGGDYREYDVHPKVQ